VITEVAVREHFQEAGLLKSGRCLDRCVQSADVRISDLSWEWDFAVGSHGNLVPLPSFARHLDRVGASADVLVGVLDRHFIFSGS